VLLKNNVVIKERVHENNTKAAKIPLTIYYDKWNNCILQIGAWQIAPPWCVNIFWCWKSGNWNMIWSLWFRIPVLATFMAKITIVDMATIFWKWVSMECEQFLFLCVKILKCNLVAVMHNWRIGSLYGEKEWDTATPLLWKGASTEHQRCLLLHLG